MLSALQEVVKISCDDESSAENKDALLLHWSNILEEFIKHNAYPYGNRDSPNANAIRTAFGRDLPLRAKKLEEMLSKSQRRWCKLRKVLSTPKKASATTAEITPLFRLRQLENAQIPGVTLSEYYRQANLDKTSEHISRLKILR